METGIETPRRRSRVMRALMLFWAVAWRTLVLVAGLVAVAQLVCWGGMLVNPPTKTYRWVVPDTTHGEVLLRCLVAGAPPLPMEDGFRLVRLAEGARVLDTGDEYVFGNEYYREEFYIQGPGGRSRIKNVDCQVMPSAEHVRVNARCTFP